MGWILWLVQGADVTPEKVCRALPISSDNHGSLYKDTCTVIVYVWILWLKSKLNYYNLPWSSMPLDLIQDHLFIMCVCWILTGSSEVYVILSLQGYGHMVTTGYHPKYPTGCKPEDMNYLVSTVYRSQGQDYNVTFYYVWLYVCLGT